MVENTVDPPDKPPEWMQKGKMKKKIDLQMPPQGVPKFKDRISRRTHDEDGLPLAVGRYQFIAQASDASDCLGLMIDTVTGKMWNVTVEGYCDLEPMEKPK